MPYETCHDVATIRELLAVAELRIKVEGRTKKMMGDLEQCLRLFNVGKLSTPSEQRIRGADPWRKPEPDEMRALLDCKPVNVISTGRYPSNALRMFPSLRFLVLLPRPELLRYRGVGSKWVGMIDKELRRFGLHVGMTQEEFEALCTEE